MNLLIIRILSLLCLVSLNLWLVSAIDILVTHHSNGDDVFGPQDSPRRIDQSLPSLGPIIKYVQSSPPSSSASIGSSHYHDPLNVDHSNLFYIEEGADTHELTSLDYGHGHYPHSSLLPTSYDTSGYSSSFWPSTSTTAIADKKSSKFFSEEVSFVVAVVTLAVFLCFLSSALIPLAVLLLSSGTGIGGLFPFTGLQNLLSGTNTMLNGGTLGNIGTMVTMGRRRRKRSATTIDHNLFDSYLSRFYKALNKFN